VATATNRQLFLYLELGGPEGGRSFPLATGRTTLGRDSGNDIKVVKFSVSRWHAEILVRGGQVRVRDLGSRNGTWVSGRRLEPDGPAVAVGEEDELRFGDLRGCLCLGLGEDVILGSETSVPSASLSTVPLDGHEQVSGETVTVGSVPSGPPDAGATGEIDESAARFLESLARIAREHAERPSSPDLLAGLLEEMARLTGARDAVLLTRVGESFVVEARAGSGDQVQVSRTVLERVFSEAALVLVPDTAQDGSAEVASLSGHPVGTSIFCLPLVEASEVFGAVYLVRASEGAVPAVGPRILELLSSVASLLVSRERLHRRLVERAEALERRGEAAARETRDRFRTDEIVGSSPEFLQALETADRVADSTVNVLLTGESGTGKELFARRIHERSPRAGEPFVAVNCAAIPENLLEAELFGIERGVATGVERREGRFELAHGGTLFLDEVGDLPLPAQAAILRALEEKQVTRVGGKRPWPADVRIVSATNRDLRAMVGERRFRDDLAFRLRVVEVPLPALRRRRGDILELALHFLRLSSREQHKAVHHISLRATRALERYEWPGNVRELRNAVERAVVLARSEVVQVEDLPVEVRQCGARDGAAPGTGEYLHMGWTEARKAFERDFFEARLAAHEGRLEDLAQELGISRRALHMKMKEHGLAGGAPGGAAGAAKGRGKSPN
jgi:transcriptional regulator with GAF, ATPase, and Fis domain